MATPNGHTKTSNAEWVTKQAGGGGFVGMVEDYIESGQADEYLAHLLKVVSDRIAQAQYIVI